MAEIKTSIAVDADLWKRFKIGLLERLDESSYSRGLEVAMQEWLDGKAAVFELPLTPIDSRIIDGLRYFLKRTSPTPEIRAPMARLMGVSPEELEGFIKNGLSKKVVRKKRA